MNDEELRQAMDALKEGLEDDYPPSRILEPGDAMVGEIEGLSKGQTKMGPAHILVLRTERGLESLWILHSVLKNELARIRPGVGEVIAIKYLGKQKTKDGQRDFHNYRVAVLGREAEALQWDELDAEQADGIPIDAGRFRGVALPDGVTTSETSESGEMVNQYDELRARMAAKERRSS